MSLWAKVRELNPDINWYGSQFPVIVRHYLAGWLERNSTMEPDAFFTGLISLIRRTAFFLIPSDKSNPDHSELLKVADYFEKNYSENRTALMEILQAIFKKEIQLLPADEAKSFEYLFLTRIDSGLKYLEQEYVTIPNMLDLMRSEIVALDLSTQKKLDLQRQISQMENPMLFPSSELFLEHICLDDSLQQAEEERQRHELEMLNFKLQIEGGIFQIYNQSVILKEELVTKHLAVWKHRNRLTRSHECDDRELEQIQTRFQRLAKLIHQTMQNGLEANTLIRKYERLVQMNNHNVIGGSNNDSCGNLAEKLKALLKKLTQDAFIVEFQPTQVIKKKTNIQDKLKVRHLIGQSLYQQKNSPQVVVTIISETKAKCLMSGNPCIDAMAAMLSSGRNSFHSPSLCTMKPKCCTLVERRNVLHGIEQMASESGNNLTATFSQMQVDGQNDTRMTVADTKCGLLCHTVFAVTREITVQVWTISEPVIIITHTCQESRARVNLMWDYEFAKIQRPPFEVPAEVTWDQFSRMLQAKFKSVVGTYLTSDHLEFLKAKLFRGDLSQDIVSLSQFNRETQHDLKAKRKFTFGEWIHEALALIKKHLLIPWTKGYIHGFISLEKTTEFLRKSRDGTFLLRFSNSVSGKITVSWVYGFGYIDSITPFGSEVLEIETLDDKLHDSALVNLYPNLSKNVFKICQSEKKSPNGYVPNYSGSLQSSRTASNTGEESPKEASPFSSSPEASPSFGLNPHVLQSFDSDPQASGPNPHGLQSPDSNPQASPLFGANLHGVQSFDSNPLASPASGPNPHGLQSRDSNPQALPASGPNPHGVQSLDSNPQALSSVGPNPDRLQLFDSNLQASPSFGPNPLGFRTSFASNPQASPSFCPNPLGSRTSFDFHQQALSSSGPNPHRLQSRDSIPQVSSTFGPNPHVLVSRDSNPQASPSFGPNPLRLQSFDSNPQASPSFCPNIHALQSFDSNLQTPPSIGPYPDVLKPFDSNSEVLPYVGSITEASPFCGSNPGMSSSLHPTTYEILLTSQNHYRIPLEGIITNVFGTQFGGQMIQPSVASNSMDCN